MQDVSCEWEKVGIREFSELSAQFSVKPKTVLKNKVYKLNICIKKGFTYTV